MAARFAQVKEEPAKRVGDTEPNAPPPSLRATKNKVTSQRLHPCHIRPLKPQRKLIHHLLARTAGGIPGFHTSR